jgi:hypothetical protein
LCGCVCVVVRFGAARGEGFEALPMRSLVWWSFDRVIRTARLRSLPTLHLRPIDVVVYHGP